MKGLLKIPATMILLMTLAGCGPLGGYSPAKPEHLDWQTDHRNRQHNQELADLLNRFHALGGFSREQLITAYDSALLRFEAGQDISSGLESSFIYALLGSPQKGARQIKAFMDQFENADFSGGREGYRGIGALVNLLLNLQRENERLCVGIREEKEHAEKLAHQLKELKNIEKIIYERENHQFRIN